MAKFEGMKIQEERYLKARSLVYQYKKSNWPSMRGNNNIVGAAFGRRIAHDEITDEPALVVYVMRKVPKKFIPPSLLIPRKIYFGGDKVEVDVVETGPFYPHSFTARERPAPAGVSIGNANEPSAGTLGSVVIDNTDNSTCILTNNHVIARQNAAAIGEMVVQQGIFDGGVTPADDIASLKRFVTLNATGNTVDGAIAEVASATGAVNVIDQVKDNIIPVATPDHPAIGLLFAGSCNRTIMNPIADVLNQLNISFPAGPNAIDGADIGMNVEKVGRTTEYTTSTIKEIDATVTIPYDFGSATFDNQITTAWMSDNGDSGSVVYRGGKGGDEDQCGCGTTSAAETTLGTSLKQERCMADVVRDKFLKHTVIGSWAMDTFFLNEERLLERFERESIDTKDRDYARKLFSKYREDTSEAFVNLEKSEKSLTEQHFKDAKSALKRAQQYMHKDEVKASEQLFALSNELAKGKNTRELLALLNDKGLLKELQGIVHDVRFLKTKDDDPCD